MMSDVRFVWAFELSIGVEHSVWTFDETGRTWRRTTELIDYAIVVNDQNEASYMKCIMYYIICSLGPALWDAKRSEIRKKNEMQTPAERGELRYSEVQT